MRIGQPNLPERVKEVGCSFHLRICCDSLF